MLAVTGATLALALGAAPAAAETAIPWGAGCTSMPPSGVRTSGTCGPACRRAGDRHRPGAPAAVKQMIAAANQIDRRPYVWGGGHLSFFTHGYDCSGAVGYALHGADLVDATMVSGQLAYWGDAGLGRWITVYANSHHVYMVVAGLRYDTRDDRGANPARAGTWPASIRRTSSPATPPASEPSELDKYMKR